MQTLCVLLVVIGACVMLYSLIVYYNSVLRNANIRAKSKHMHGGSWISIACLFMMVFFFAGYILCIAYFIISKELSLHTLFIACLLLCGAIYALAMVTLFNHLFKSERAEEELIREKEKAEQGSRAKSDFLSRMSHEIRTPMNAIIGMTSIGMSTSDIDRMKYCFAKIEDASKHLLGIINDILDMSKIEAGKFELSMAEFDFEKLLQRVVNVVSFRVDERQQKLTIYIDRSIPKILVSDDQRLAQVITNLLGNAVKFTPEKGFIRIGTQFLGEEDGVCTIQITVADTGIGISPEQQERLFKSFQQAEVNTSRKFGGTGLGLSISKNIVEMMGGRIWIESEIGAGSKFAFTIQARKGAAEEGKPPERSAVRILAVDNDQYVLSHFEVISRELGISCDTSENYDDALQKVKQNAAYDFCFINWKIHNTDGLMFAQALKENSPNVVAVLMISAMKWNEVEAEAKKADVKKFLSKPLFRSAIADIIEERMSDGRHKADETQPDIFGLLTGRRVLLAEDVEINREIVLALLEPTQIKIDCAENGAEAVRMFSESPKKYEMIFMDVQMPEMDGHEATRAIRALNLPNAKTIPIIAMTANVFLEDIEKCHESGMNGHVGKPLDFNQVLKLLKHHLLNVPDETEGVQP